MQARPMHVIGSGDSVSPLEHALFLLTEPPTQLIGIV
jgi:hypothetical protein